MSRFSFCFKIKLTAEDTRLVKNLWQLGKKVKVYEVYKNNFRRKLNAQTT